jgi:hypothetical protein
VAFFHGRLLKVRVMMLVVERQDRVELDERVPAFEEDVKQGF